MPHIVINNLSLNLPDGSALFRNISFTCASDKTGFTGKNGAGKSILAQIICGKLPPSEGSIFSDCNVSYLPQNLEHLKNGTLIDVLNNAEKYSSLQKILSGAGTANDYLTLDNDWNIEQKIFLALQRTGIEYLELERDFSSLSGGEKVRAVFSSLLLSSPNFIILDEPTNHTDRGMRKFIYDFVKNIKTGLLVISHDRELLRLMDRILELTPTAIKSYGGNYDFFQEQREIEINAIENAIQAAEVTLAKRLTEKEASLSRQASRMRQAENSKENAGIPKIMINKMKGSGEKTLAKIKNEHDKRVEESQAEFEMMKQKRIISRKMKIDYIPAKVLQQKHMIICEAVNFSYIKGSMLWDKDLSFLMRGTERFHLKGINGSGKSTLYKLILGILQPTAGKLTVSKIAIGVLDQEVSMLNDQLNVLQNLVFHSGAKIPEHELRIRLARFLFFNDDVYKKAGVLSGGERMRAGMACMFAANNSPDLLLLDEPTNNLDLISVQQLGAALKEYCGALMVISHDSDFISEIGITNEIILYPKLRTA